MATIPLQFQTPKFNDPLEMQAQSTNIRGAMQQNALRTIMAPVQMQQAQQELQGGALDLQAKQQAMADQKALSKAYLDAGGDPEKTKTLAGQYGVRPQTIMAFDQAIVEAKTKRATLTKDQLDNDTKVHEMLRGAVQAIQAQDDGTPEGQAKAAASYQSQLARVDAMAGSGQLDTDTAKLIPRQYPGADGLKMLNAWLTTGETLNKETTAADTTDRADATLRQTKNRDAATEMNNTFTQSRLAKQAADAAENQRATNDRLVDAAKATTENQRILREQGQERLDISRQRASAARGGQTASQVQAQIDRAEKAQEAYQTQEQKLWAEQGALKRILGTTKNAANPQTPKAGESYIDPKSPIREVPMTPAARADLEQRVKSTELGISTLQRQQKDIRQKMQWGEFAPKDEAAPAGQQSSLEAPAVKAFPRARMAEFAEQNKISVQQAEAALKQRGYTIQ